MYLDRVSYVAIWIAGCFLGACGWLWFLDGFHPAGLFIALGVAVLLPVMTIINRKTEPPELDFSKGVVGKYYGKIKGEE